VCEAIWIELADKVIPQCSTEKWIEIAKGFQTCAQFPNCIRAIDGKHIRTKQPPNSGSMYYNYKQYYSTVLFAMCDANYCFTYIEVGSYVEQLSIPLEAQTVSIPDIRPSYRVSDVATFSASCPTVLFNSVTDIAKFLTKDSRSSCTSFVLSALPLRDFLLDISTAYLNDKSLQSYSKFCGPGTRLQKRLALGQKGINKLDGACLQHDIAYQKSDLTTRHVADYQLEQDAWKRVKSPDAKLGEKAAALLVTNIMKTMFSFIKSSVMSNTFTLTGYTSKLSANFYPPIELDISAEYGLTHEGDESNVVTLPEGVYEIEDINKYIQNEIISMNDTYKERYENKVDEMFSLKANTNTEV
ncbi:unnamed protein product, partial [Acanthoscelides obtectus]